MADAIVVRSLGKRYRRQRPDRPATLQEALLGGLRRWPKTDEFWALRDISFSIPTGNTVGIVGTNGAGKSTLLRLLGGVGKPDEGSVDVNGRIGALLDLGAAFHGDLSGRENVFVAGVIAGLTRREVIREFDAIVDFAELAPFIDNPYRTYSSGMKMRLGFAVAVHASPETLLMDELLSVGDHAFQRKCLERITGFRRAGCTIVLASHDTIMIRRLCDDVLWLREGQLIELGEAEATVTGYLTAPQDETRHRTPVSGPVVVTRSGAELRLHENRFGSLELEVTDVRLLDRNGLDVTELDAGDPLRIEMEYIAHKPVRSPIFTAAIASDEGVRCCETHTAAGAIEMPTLMGRGRIALEIERLDLNRGQYWVDVRVNSPDWSYAYDHHVDVYTFTMRTGDEEAGVLNPPLAWDLRGVPGQGSLRTPHAGVNS
jgi:lipopolysaccharide transport system ATP-binding protein